MLSRYNMMDDFIYSTQQKRLCSYKYFIGVLADVFL